MKDFIKFGEYYIPIDDILYIHTVGCGCTVYLKSSPDTVRVSDLPDEDWADFMKKCLNKKEVVITNE